MGFASDYLTELVLSLYTRWLLRFSTLAPSSTASCSPPEATQYNFRAKRAKRETKASLPLSSTFLFVFYYSRYVFCFLPLNCQHAPKQKLAITRAHRCQGIMPIGRNMKWNFYWPSPFRRRKSSTGTSSDWLEKGGTTFIRTSPNIRTNR